MAKILLVDTNFSSGPIYEELVSMGHEVHVVGANPLDCLAKVSPNYWNVNYADTAALADLVKNQEFDCLVPGCTDRSYESCVAINDGRFAGIDGVEANRAISNKGEFRRIAEQLGLPVPKTQNSGLDPSNTPIIVKPADAFSGKGITILREKNDSKMAAAINLARDTSPSGQYLIEEFVEGQLHSHSAFLKSGKVVQDFVVQEDGTVNPFVVDTSRVLQRPSNKLRMELRACVEKLAEELRLVDGLIHTQFIANGDSFWLIELTRRCPGDLYSQLIELSTGFPYARSYALSFIGQDIAPFSQDPSVQPIMRHTLTLKSEQSFAYVRFKRPILTERWVPLCLVGDQLKPSPYSRIGILFCRASDDRDLELIYQDTLQRDLYEVRS